MRSREPFKTEVIGTVSCPNCNAQARVVAVRRKRTTPFWEILGRCDKCKSEWPAVTEDGSGPLMHDRHKRSIDRHRELMKKYDAATTPGERGKIMAEVQHMAREEKRWWQSL